MKTLKTSVFVLVTTLAASTLAFGQQPPDVVTSDALGNTAMGTGALISTGPDCGPNPPGCNYGNTAAGYKALYSNLGGNQNTAIGAQALYSNTTTGLPFTLQPASGDSNTAVGYQALYSNTNASGNTAIGNQALYSNITTILCPPCNVAFGEYNTAVGDQALYSNTSGQENTASGVGALFFNTTGSNNTASGASALSANTTANYNTATGAYALSNATGCCNTATGNNALLSDTTGNNNTAEGNSALYFNTTGYNNTAVGEAALHHNSTGTTNIALGYYAGAYLTTGSYNIEIGNRGAVADHGAIRIGTSGQQVKSFIAGIYGVSVAGNAVAVSSTGQLGVTVSSERYKTAIAPMGGSSEKLQQLRPVTFHLKTDPTGALQYGLIAEEVAKVYPELVIRDANGRIDGVRYDELAPMLLNELQQQRMAAAAQAAEIRDLKQQQKTVGEMQKELTEMHAVLLKLQAKDDVVAQR